MKVYEVYNPDLDANVRYRVLTPEEMEAIVLEYADDGHDRFSRAVLETVIYNLKTDVSLALKKLSKAKAKLVLDSLFNGCLMLNPGLDINSWLLISNAPNQVSAAAAVLKAKKSTPIQRRRAPRKISRQKFMNLERHLKDRVIGQDEAIDELVAALKRVQVGLNDETRPTGVFLFAGASGVGKTYLARELHSYLFGEETELIRVDCGEYQHKHENAKLLGAPPGYLGHDEGGQLTNAMLKSPQTVVLLDEVEKAHPDMWNTFLRVFDEGILTDSNGKKVSFRESIIIMTTNLGNGEIVSDMMNKVPGFNSHVNIGKLPRRERVESAAKEAIRKQFRPEFLNRIDKTVVFNHLQHDDYKKIAELELQSVQAKLEKRGFILTFDDSAIDAMVRDGVSHVQGVRGLAQLRRDRIENSLADLMLSGRFPRGTAFQVNYDADDYRVVAHRPVSKKRNLNSVAPIPTASLV